MNKPVPPYHIPQAEKEKILLDELTHLTELHRKNCKSYEKILQIIYNNKKEFLTLEELPYLPVNLFKMQKLMSIREDEVFKIIQSSGTSSTIPSTLFLDIETAQRQTMRLSDIMTSFLGTKRLPLLILDQAEILHDKVRYSARGAALMGMLPFGRDVCFALNAEMQCDHERIQQWASLHKDEKVILFGITSILWKHFLSELQVNEIVLPQGILIHTGGWKKMEAEGISNEMFKKQVFKKTSIKECHNFYGMAEQVGSVFMECEYGALHCPFFADIIIRDPKSWKASPQGMEGVIQVLSNIPTSYPGHSLLTEDLGILLGVDDCPCTRLGKYFHVVGRIPKASIRGCSDTYAV